MSGRPLTARAGGFHERTRTIQLLPFVCENEQHEDFHYTVRVDLDFT
jgi:hypothetical protein